jgi:hypothetical protein
LQTAKELGFASEIKINLTEQQIQERIELLKQDIAKKKKYVGNY